MDITKTHKIISYLLLFINVFLMPITLITLINGRSFLGNSLNAILFLLPIHLLIITSLLALTIKFKKNKTVLAFNILGLIYTLFISSIIILIIIDGQEKCIS